MKNESNQRLLFAFLWILLLIIICILGATGVLADTVPASLSYSSSVEQQLYNSGGDNWVTCKNNSCSLWNSDKSGVPSWLSYTFSSSLKSGVTYFFEISIQFNYVNNSSSSIPVWKLSNYANEGDNYSGRINRDMISCSNADISISNNTEVAKWSCSFSPKQDYENFEFYLWTNKNYNSLSNNGVFMPYNSSTYKLNSYKLSYLDSSTGTLITQNQQIIDQTKKNGEKLDDINKSLTDSSSPDMSALNNTTGWLPSGPIDSILNLPLNMLQALNTSLSKSCTPLNLTIPFLKSNNTIQLPCISTLYQKIEGFSTLWTWIGSIVSILMLYTYLLNLYKWVDNTLTFRENNDLDNWGGL